MTSETQTHGDLWRLVKLARPSGWRLVAAALAACVAAGATLWFPMLTKDFLDQVGTRGFDWRAILLLAAVPIAGSVVGALSNYQLARVGYDVVATLRRLLVDKLLGL